MQSTVPLSQHHNFGIRDKGDPREESKRAERERPENRKTHKRKPRQQTTTWTSYTY